MPEVAPGFVELEVAVPAYIKKFACSSDMVGLFRRLRSPSASDRAACRYDEVIG
jgi:hypothetical protein